MAVIDAKLIYMNNTAAGESVTSNVIELGANGSNLNPLYIDVKLTEGVTAGAVKSVKVQSSVDKAFTTPIDEMEIFIPAARNQKVPCQLVQTFCPITPGGRYARLVVTGSTTTDGTAIAGGKLWAYISPDIQVPVL